MTKTEAREYLDGILDDKGKEALEALLPRLGRPVEFDDRKHAYQREYHRMYRERKNGGTT